LFGLGLGEGPEAAAHALEGLKLCPLLHTPEFARKADRLLVNITGGPDLSLTKVNELMNAVTEEFGKEAHVIMGATIDENMAGRVEICVLGATDAGGRFVRRAPLPARRTADKPAESATAHAPETNPTLKSTITPASGGTRPAVAAAKGD